MARLSKKALASRASNSARRKAALERRGPQAKSGSTRRMVNSLNRLKKSVGGKFNTSAKAAKRAGSVKTSKAGRAAAKRAGGFISTAGGSNG